MISEMIDNANSHLSQFAFPRTGKRGVPQQFPRRLYEMLDCETRNAAANVRHPKLIAWSDSGKSFRIHNVTEFTAIVLPKYFRTHKFSSFQRNLNLVRAEFCSAQVHRSLTYSIVQINITYTNRHMPFPFLLLTIL